MANEFSNKRIKNFLICISNCEVAMESLRLCTLYAVENANHIFETIYGYAKV